ncbi:hypothetical protein G7046_g6624 [Stylonectria norvegica]|nr:hypothetical protein G7046_g6624 [Stylonectria norvegica]
MAGTIDQRFPATGDITGPSIQHAKSDQDPNPLEKADREAYGTRGLPVSVEDCDDDDATSTGVSLRPPSGSDMPSSTGLKSPSTNQNYSESSSDSGSTVTHNSYTKKTQDVDKRSPRQGASREIPRRQSSRGSHRPNALQFLDPESPTVMHDSKRRSADMSQWRGANSGKQTSPSASSSTSGSFHSDVFSEPNVAAGSDRSWSPEHALSNESPSIGHSKVNNPFPAVHQGQQGHHHPPHTTHMNNMNHASHMNPMNPMSPMSPMAPLENANLPPQFPINSLQPQFATPFQIPRFPHVESVPLSGYQLLATKLVGRAIGPPVKPSYRVFEIMNHRVLLHLQDELSELEEELTMLDKADTQLRRSPGGIFPASRRQEQMNANVHELAWRKKDIINRIGFKLVQYYTVISSLKGTLELAAPSMEEVNEYRAYLAHQQPVVDVEARFLDNPDDLVLLAREPTVYERQDDLLTPMSRPMADAGFPPGNNSSDTVDYQFNRNFAVPTQPLPDGAPRELAIATVVAILVPLLVFSVIPEFIGRIAVVLLVAAGVVMSLVQSGLFRLLTQARGGLDCMVCLGVYGAIMALLARAFT